MCASINYTRVEGGNLLQWGVWSRATGEDNHMTIARVFFFFFGVFSLFLSWFFCFSFYFPLWNFLIA